MSDPEEFAALLLAIIGFDVLLSGRALYALLAGPVEALESCFTALVSGLSGGLGVLAFPLAVAGYLCVMWVLFTASNAQDGGVP